MPELSSFGLIGFFTYMLISVTVTRNNPEVSNILTEVLRYLLDMGAAALQSFPPF